MNNKKFYVQVNFYLMAVACILATVAVVVYATCCPSEFNGNIVSPTVVTWDIVAIIAGVLAMVCDIAKSYVSKDSVVSKILDYTRVLKYVAFLGLLYSFLSAILYEYSLLGTILYPIFSGTVGDPVDPVISGGFFISLIITLVGFILALVSGLIQKGQYYKAAKNQTESV